MMIQNVHRGRAKYDVVMLDTNNWDDSDIIAKALEAAGESATSNFGVTVKRYPNESSAIATIWID